MNTTQTCQHSLYVVPEDQASNNAILREQKEFRQVGEEFFFNRRQTCYLCGERVFVKQKLKRMK